MSTEVTQWVRYRIISNHTRANKAKAGPATYPGQGDYFGWHQDENFFFLRVELA